jgi:hypothetical protein
MLAEIFKKSRRVSITTRNISVTYVYWLCMQDVWDEDESEVTLDNDHEVALGLVEDEVPVFHVIKVEGTDYTIIKSDVELNQVGDYEWEATVKYTLPELEGGSSSYVELGFAMDGGSQTITKSILVRSSHSATSITDPIPDLKGAIGYTKNGIQGTERLTRGLTFTITAYFAPVIWTSTYIKTLYNISKCYNDDVFFTFAAGEVLFINASGQGSYYKVVPVTFNFVASPNISGAADPGFPALTMLGHDVVDYLYYEGTDGTSDDLIMVPSYRYVHQIYEPADFTLLGIGS